MDWLLTNTCVTRPEWLLAYSLLQNVSKPKEMIYAFENLELLGTITAHLERDLKYTFNNFSLRIKLLSEAETKSVDQIEKNQF